MAVGYFEVGQKVWLKGVGYVIDSINNDGQVRLQTIHTKRYEFMIMHELKVMYVNGDLMFTPESVGNTSDFELMIAGMAEYELNALPEKEYNKVIKRHSYVCAVKDENPSSLTKKTLDPVIKDVWVKLGRKGARPSLSSIRRWVDKYDEGGQDIRSLMTQNCNKGNRTRRIKSGLIEIVTEAVSTIYLSDVRATIKDVIDHAVVLVKRVNAALPEEEHLQPPTRSIVKSEINKIPAFDLMVARKGRQAAIKAFRTSKGKVVATRLLERAEIDHTIFDLIIVHDETYMPLGRPTVTVCLDDASRCVLGLYVGFEPPGFSAVAHCLRESFLPKVDLKEKYPRVEGEWAAHGVPENLVVDNGLEFHSRGLESLCYSFGINIHYTPRKTPWFKAKVERFIGTLNRGVAHGNPGTTFSNFFEKGDYDAAKNAVIRQSDFEEMVRIWVVDYYHQSLHRSLGNKPSVAWSESVIDTPIPLPSDIHDLDFLCAIPSKKHRKVTHAGIQINNLFYNSDDLRDMRMRLGETFKAEVRYSPSDLSSVFVVTPDTKHPVRVEAVNKEYTHGLTLWAHKLCTKQAKIMLERSDIEALAEVKEKLKLIALDSLGNKKMKTRKIAKRFLDAVGADVMVEEGALQNGELSLFSKEQEYSDKPVVIDGVIKRKSFLVKNR